MPLEIKELHIKAVVNNKEQQGASSNNAGEQSAPCSEKEQNQLVRICVDKVLEILKEKMER